MNPFFLAENNHLRIIRLFLIIILTLISLAPTQSQNHPYLFKKLDTQTGLSDNHINAILRDNTGFLWIGTHDGLNRYDGTSCKVFRYNPHDSTSLRSNTIQILSEDSRGNIWVDAGEYLDIIDPTTNTIQHVDSLFNGKLKFKKQSRWQLLVDSLGNEVYKCTFLGVYKYFSKEDSLQYLIKSDTFGTPKRTYITSIDLDSKGNIWAANNKGTLFKINHQTNQITDSISLVRSMDGNLSLLIDKDDDIWAYDLNTNSGFYLVNTISQQVQHFSTQSKTLPIPSNFVATITEDSKGLIWAVIDKEGVLIIDKNKLTFVHIKNIPHNEQSLAENSANTIYSDADNFIWIGTNNHGVSYFHYDMFKFNTYAFNNVEKNFPHINDISSFAEDENGNLWIGTNGEGLIYFNRKNGKYKIYKHNPKDPNSLSSDIIIGLTIDSKKNLWIGTYMAGLNLWDGEKFTNFRMDTTNSWSITDDRVWDILEADDGYLWIATLLGGINIMNPETHEIEKVYRENDGNTVQSSVVYTFMQDSKERIWIATVHGLVYYDNKTDTFFKYKHDQTNNNSLSNNTIFNIHEDSRGLIWASTYNGINIIEPETNKIQHLYIQDGLPSNTCKHILEDNEENIWVSTSKGLSKIIVSKRDKDNYEFTIKNYAEKDGLVHTDFKEMAGLKTQNGELFFGTANGFISFNPTSINTLETSSKIVLTSFTIFNNTISNKTTGNDRHILTKDIAYTDEIELKHNENFFSITFSDLSFLQAGDKVYEYKLEGLSDVWMKASPKLNSISFTDLKPGEYLFKIRAIGDINSNDNDLTELKITVKSPFWGSWWFRLLVFLILSGIIFNRIRESRLHRKILEKRVKERTRELTKLNEILKDRQDEISTQNNELNKHRNELEQLIKNRTKDLQKALVKAEESDKLKSTFLANMSHEIRTPMNAIIGFTEMLTDKNTSEKEKDEYIGIIRKNSDTLLVIIDDILDLSKIEANQIQLYKNEFDIIGLLLDLESIYKIKTKKSIVVKFNKPEFKELIILNDDVRIRQVLQNLITNAIKYTNSGSVEFGFTLNANIICFYVKDTGIGIPEDNHEMIFTPFSKVEDKKVGFIQGVGLGLAICKKIALLMKGKISFVSEVKKGSTFYFEFPIEIIKRNSTPTTDYRNELLVPDSNSDYEILVAEDEKTNFDLIKTIFKYSNINLHWATNGEKAVEFVKNNPKLKLLILMDIKMPKMDGFEAFTEIKKIRKNLKIIAITAYAYQQERKEILDRGFDDYIAKPFKSKKLLETIDTVMRNGFIH